MIFHYYFPNVSTDKITREFIRERDLGDVFRDCLKTDFSFSKYLCKSHVFAGPDNNEGTIVGIHSTDSQSDIGKFGFYPDEQEWKPIGSDPENPDYWLGWFPSKPPTHATLCRETTITGYEHELDDGNHWLCPRIGWPGYEILNCNLPQKIGCDSGGEWDAEIKAEFRETWKRAGEIFDLKIDLIELEIGKQIDTAAFFLAINYRIGKHEITALELFDDCNFVHVLNASIDGDSLRDYLLSLVNEESGEEEIPEAEKKTETKSHAA